MQNNKSITLLFRPLADGSGWELCAPAVGMVRNLAMDGAPLEPGDLCGVLEILGVPHALRLPTETVGQAWRVKNQAMGHPPSDGPGCAAPRLWAVSYGQLLLLLKKESADTATTASSALHKKPQGAQGMILCAPQAGRFYRCPDPTSAPFVEKGDLLEFGRTVGLLEVMKTFSPIKYGSFGNFPSTAQIKSILVDDRADVEEGAPLLELET